MPFKKGNHLAGNRKASPNITAQLPSGALFRPCPCANQSWFRLIIDVTTASGAVHSVGDMAPRRVARPAWRTFHA
jgi:hypothetical protein